MKNTYYDVDALATAKFFIAGEKHEEAKIVLDLIRPYCHTIEQYDAIGKLYSEIRDFETCEEIASHLYSILPEPAKSNARVSLIRSLLHLNRPKDAMFYVEEHEKLYPDEDSNLMDRAMALFLMNRKKEAEKIIRDILKKPLISEDTRNRINFNLGTYNLANGNFKEGLKGFLLNGRKLDIWKTYPFPKEREWTGQQLPTGTTIVLCAEGGIGDEIINVRFIKHLSEIGYRPIWYTTRRDLANVFNRCGFPTVTNVNTFHSDWYWTYSMAVPCYLDIDEKDLWYGKYLWPDRPSKKDEKYKIGIKTCGNPKYDQDLHRTIPIEGLLKILPLSADTYNFNIEKDFSSFGGALIPLKDHLITWDETLKYIADMDIIITSCTSIAHAASAMEKKTFVLVPILNYYVWTKPGKHSPWYSNNTTIIRQVETGNWDEPIRELQAYLHENTHSHA